MANIIKTTPLTINNLDFPSIKDAFKSFISNQTEFKDFDFDGSNISSLMDILCYNTYYNIFYSNILMTESFLDSATQRESLISIMKPVGFMAKSFTCAKLLVNIYITASLSDTATSQIIIPNYTSFISGSLSFINLIPLVLTRDNKNNFSSTDPLLLYEGKKIQYRFIVTDPSIFFKIPYNNIDISTMRVRVFPDLHSYETFSPLDNPLIIFEVAEKLYTVDDRSQVYFLQEETDGNYSIYFGDGIIGKAIHPGNIIEVVFIISSGTLGNNLSILSFDSTDQGNTTISGYSSSNIIVSPVVADLKSFDGSEKEDIESIRKYSPYHFEAQDRIITINDYEYYIRHYFNNIELLRIWGGEENDPPRYGTVFVMLKLTNLEVLSQYQKSTLTKYIKTKSILGLNLILVDPNIVYILPSLEIKIDPYIVKDTGLFTTNIMSYLQQYTSTKFSGESFRPSEIIYFLKNSESLIKSINCTTKIVKNIYVIPGSLETNIISFSTSIMKSSLISSTNFSLDSTSTYTNEYLNDDGSGHIIYNRTNSSTNITDTLIMGNIDYINGIVTLTNFLLVKYLDTNNFFRLTCIPTNIDLYTDNKSLFSLNYSTIVITLIFDTKR